MATQEAAIETPAASVEEFETIVIGGGQAGLAVGYYLKKGGGSFVILDANEQIGGSWRTRTWSSLRLFTPARYDGLPGWAFPAPGWSYPTASETADYLEAYAERFELPVRPGERRPADEGRRSLPRRVRRAALRGRSGRRRDRLLREAVGARLRIRARPTHRADALQRLPRSLPASAGRRAPRRRRQLRGRHRDGDVRDAPDLALGPRQRTGAGSASRAR